MEKNKDMTESYRIQIGMQLRMTREAQGWDTVQVAAMAGVKAQTVEKIEAGAFNVPLDVLARVADVLGVEITFKPKSV